MKPAVYTFKQADTQAICASQGVTTTGYLLLNGTEITTPSNGISYWQGSPGWQRIVTATTTDATLTGVSITVSGFSVSGVSLTETFTGPGANSTVSSANQYARVIGAYVSGTAVNLSIGTGTPGQTKWFTTDYQKNPVNISLYFAVSGTLNYNIQDTPANIQTSGSPVTFNHPTMSGTASLNGNYAFAPRYIRAVLNTVGTNSSASAVFTIIQAGAR